MNDFLKVLMLFFCLSPLACNVSKPLPVHGALEPFEFTDYNGQKKTLQDYKGKVWVANFVFTSCAGTCPMLTMRMKKFDEALSAFKKENPEAQVAIVSFTVDPERDTPEKLKTYRQEYEIKSDYWTFLTGATEKVTKVVVKGFKISMAKVDSDVSDFDVVHGEKFVLVDQKGQIRGYYDSDNSGRQELFRDLKKLINQKVL